MRKFLPLLLFLPSISWGAIAFDNATKQNTSAIFKNAAPWAVSWSHTCTGSNLLLTVETTLQGTVSSLYVDSVTYNNVAMTRVAASSGTTDTEIWALANPASGANTINVNLISTSTSIGGMAFAISLTGVNQSTPVDVSTAGVLASATTVSLSATTTQNNDWFVDAIYIFNTGTLSSTSGTPRTGFLDTGDVALSSASTRGPLTPAGSFSMGYTLGSASNSDFVVVAIQPAPTGGFNKAQRLQRLED